MPRLGILFMAIIYLLVNVYIYFHGRQALPKNTAVQTVYLCLFVLLSASFFVARLLEGHAAWSVTSALGNIGGAWIMLLMYFLMIALLTDLVRVANHFADFYPLAIKQHYAQAKLVYLGVVLLIAVVASVVGYVNFSNPRVVTLHLDVPQRQSSLDSLSIVAVSDIHLGDVIRKKRARKYMELINSRHADVILIAGDVVDQSLASVKVQHLEEELRLLNAKYGVYAVVGNHDYFSNVLETVEFIRSAGIVALRDSAVTVDNNFVLIGRDDFSNKKRKPLSALTPQEAKLPTILLDHQPQRLSEAVDNNIDLQISGHTHNGQLFPFTLIVARMYELVYGYQKRGNTHIYVTSGLGLWGAPLRLGSQSEIVNIRLNFVKEESAPAI